MSSLLTPVSSLLTPISSLLTPESSLLTPASLLLIPISSLLTSVSSLLTPVSSLLTPVVSRPLPLSEGVGSPRPTCSHVPPPPREWGWQQCWPLWAVKVISHSTATYVTQTRKNLDIPKNAYTVWMRRCESCMNLVWMSYEYNRLFTIYNMQSE